MASVKYDEMLNAINLARTTNNKPRVAWCSDCSKSAQEQADKIAQRGGVLEHGCLVDSHGQMGQNIALGGKNFTFDKALAMWMQEQCNYRGGNSYQPGCGHFTQVVWKSTTHVGVGVAKIPCGNGAKTIIVANFHPPGNFDQQFAANV